MVPYQRVALYILFDSIEADLISHIRSAARSDEFLTDSEREKALARIARNPEAGVFGLADSDLIISLDLGDKYDILLRKCPDLGDLCSYFRSQHANFIKLIAVRNDIMHGRPLTMDQQVRALAFAQDLLINPGVWPRLSKTYREYSANPAAFINRSITFLDDTAPTTCLHNLPVPDFDDTGWLPRLTLEQDLKRKVLGRHPVVSILGDGGNGKTALALQVLHNLVRTNDHDFDAIIWTSAKATSLTVGGIEDIEGATVEAIDIMDAAAVLQPVGDSPLERLATLLSENKILLVIDNYESVIGDEIRSFSQDVPGESKLLFTSRHPIGGDLTVIVGELEKVDAFRYFHRLIQVYGLTNIYKSHDNADFERWLERLSYKPLAIKWLVLGLKSGLNGEMITSSPEDVLRFCLDNVIGGLGNEAQAVIFVLATLPAPASPSVIREVSALTALQVVDGIAELNRFNLVEARVTDDGAQVFAVRPFARSFIHRLITPKPEVRDRILENYRNIEALYQAARGANKIHPYSFRNYSFNNRSQLLLSRDLKNAVDLSFDQRFDQAERLLANCKNLDPGYFENHRAEAMIAFSQNDLTRAIDALKVAIKLDPEQAKLHYLLGNYYLKLADHDLAKVYFDKAIELLPDFFPLREAARNEMLRFEFDEAQSYLDRANELRGFADTDRIQLVDIQVQLYTRRISFLVSNRRFQDSIPIISDMLTYLNGLKDTWVDDRTVEHIMGVIPSVIALRKALPDEDICLELLILLEKRFMEPSHEPQIGDVPRGKLVGHLKQIGLKPDYGFLETDGFPDVFVHISETGFGLWSYMISGGQVTFDAELKDEGRYTARNVRASL